MKKCSIDGCDRAFHTKGMCGMHAQRFRRHSKNMITKPPPGTAMKKISFALLAETDDCIIWSLFVNHNGYGDIRIDRKTTRAHHLICKMAHGDPPFPKAQAAHSCGNKLCINKRHIRWASRSENERDKVAHGRSNRGERQGLHKLTEGDVREIRKLWRKGEGSSHISEIFGVAPRTIRDAANRVTWSWLD